MHIFIKTIRLDFINMTSCNEQLEMGIPLNSNSLCQPKASEGTPSLSTDRKVWFSYGVTGGGMVQLASIGVAFLVVGHSDTVFISAMISTSLCVIALWNWIFRFLDIILRYEFPSCYDTEWEVKAADDTVSTLRNSFLYGIAGGGLFVTIVVHLF